MITTRKNLRGNETHQSVCEHIVSSSEVTVEESDEENELTNLNWLLRNQNVTWPIIIEGNSDDDINTNVSLIGNQISETDKNIEKNKNLAENGDHAKVSTKKSVTTNFISLGESKKNNVASTAEPPKRLSPSERFEIFINKIKRDLAEYEKSEFKYKTDVTQKPPFNYSHIIGMAMLENGRVTLQQICAWIESKFAFFRARKKWNNSIRHNLSLHHCFRNRKREEKGKGGYWELGVDPKKCDRRRIRNRKTGQSKLIPAIQIGKKHCQLTAFEIITHSHSDETQFPDKNSNQVCYQYEQHSQHKQQENHYIGAEKISQLDLGETTRSLSEIDVGHGLSLSNVLNSRIQDIDNTFLCNNELGMSVSTNTENLQSQYELGTIIISTSGIVDEKSCLNSIINNKFTCTNMIYAENDIPMSNENVVISSHMSTVLDVNKDADLTFITPAGLSSEFPISLANNCEYSNFRTYLDGVDETFNYLHTTEINRSEDIFDNLLDVCVRDY